MVDYWQYHKVLPNTGSQVLCGDSIDFGVRLVQAKSPIWLHVRIVISIRLFNLLKPLSPHLYKGLMVLATFKVLTKKYSTMFAKNLSQHMVHSRF